MRVKQDSSNEGGVAEVILGEKWRGVGCPYMCACGMGKPERRTKPKEGETNGLTVAGKEEYGKWVSVCLTRTS